jgi:hypothetical protein
MVDRNQIVSRLKQLGYDATDSDYTQIDFELTKILNYVINNFTRSTNIPEILDLRIVDRVCCEFLFYKKNSGSLNGFNYDAVIKTIKEGDTSITYAVGQGEDTPESRFDSFLKSLERGFDKWCTVHRRLVW